MKKLILLISLLTCLGNLTAYAQHQPMRSMVQLTPKQMAAQKTAHIEKELALTDKQSKKVYKLYLNQAKKAQQSQSGGTNSSFGGPPPGEGSFKGMGDRQGPHQRGERPEREESRREFPAGTPYQEPEKDIAKRDEKMKKILSTEQYQKWLLLEEEMKLSERNKRRKEEIKKQFPELDIDKIENNTYPHNTN